MFMPKIYRISRSGLRLFYKIRHHKGHGIHSPFVFRLISRVIEEKGLYYAYENIYQAIHDNHEIHKKTDKYDLLSFRLVNYFNAKKILELGSGEGINTLCLTASNSQIECVCFESSPEKSQKALSLYQNWNRNITLFTSTCPTIKEKQDCISINLNNFHATYEWVIENLFPHIDDHTFIIIKGIRTKRKYQMLWKQLISSDKVTVSLDLYNEGILFFNSKLHKRNYAISF